VDPLIDHLGLRLESPHTLHHFLLQLGHGHDHVGLHLFDEVRVDDPLAFSVEAGVYFFGLFLGLFFGGGGLYAYFDVFVLEV
jgi:hypothetical protein